jgi:hypothetical protein
MPSRQRGPDNNQQGGETPHAHADGVRVRREVCDSSYADKRRAKQSKAAAERLSSTAPRQ